MGMNRLEKEPPYGICRVPRVYGDEPVKDSSCVVQIVSSPCVWG